MGDGLTVRLTGAEMVALVGSLREALYGLKVHDFSTRVGASREDAAELLEQLLAALDSLSPGDE